MMANSSTETRTVFLVDDDSSSVDLYSKGLEQAGFKTAAALDAAKAREALENLSPDLMILDLMLPQRGGLELLQAIRADIRHKNTPILVLSNAYLPDITQKALRSGGNKALVRSECTSSELVSVSREMLGIAENNGNGDTAQGATGGTGAADGAVGGLAERLMKDLTETGSAEVAAICQQFLRYVEARGSQEGRQCLDAVYQSIRSLGTRGPRDAWSQGDSDRRRSSRRASGCHARRKRRIDGTG